MNLYLMILIDSQLGNRCESILSSSLIVNPSQLLLNIIALANIERYNRSHLGIHKSIAKNKLFFFNNVFDETRVCVCWNRDSRAC